MSSSITTTDHSSDSTILNSPSTRPRPSSKFKGVVYQRNGNVGAQIYVNHQRFWLGTFKTEIQAAMAYDSAALKLQQESFGHLVHRNFPCTTALTLQEHKFQAPYTSDQVLNMIKDGSYQNKFAEFLRSTSEVSVYPQMISYHNGEQEVFSTQEFFRKELTVSDVGNLHRFVIPKRYAVKYFPSAVTVSRKHGGGEGEKDGGGRGGDMKLVFYDNAMKKWEFKYCYWKSSQSFVFTRGWINFVKAKNLEPKDIVVFYMCEVKENDGEDLKKFWLIKIIKTNNAITKGETKRNKGLRLFGVQLVPAN